MTGAMVSIVAESISPPLIQNRVAVRFTRSAATSRTRIESVCQSDGEKQIAMPKVFGWR